MDGNTLVTLIGNVGFPIVICLYMLWQSREERKSNREMLEKITAAHENESKKYMEVIANNTLAIAKLTDKLEG